MGTWTAADTKGHIFPENPRRAVISTSCREQNITLAGEERAVLLAKCQKRKKRGRTCDASVQWDSAEFTLCWEAF